MCEKITYPDNYDVVARYVPYRLIPAYLRLGWMTSGDLADCYHGQFADLMLWPCQCPLREPPR